MEPIYRSGTSLLHQLHPLTKIAATLFLVAAVFTLPGLLSPAAIFLLVLLIAAIVGLAGHLGRTAFGLILPILVSLFLIQGVLFPPPGATPLFSIGPLTLRREGLVFAFLISTRLLAAISSMLLTLQTTHPADLVFALTSIGLPRSIGYILLVSLQIIPAMVARAGAIQEAQRSRGLETERGLLRVRALVPLISPLVVGALVDVEQRAMALESRAYTAPGPKTSLRQLVDTPAQRVARWLLLGGVVALVVGSFTLW
ncbi:MAG: energy-coupling factor transporter transmembrane protein EcfT [Chloroflexales bacterium]|nr:energy-coupling factor transporter transmembrane protein EcfT [Chloroflexales bacterium]